MFACLYSSSASQQSLLELASSFSPLVENTARGVVVFSILGLSKLIGAPDEIAAVIARKGAEAGIQANLAISADPDTAVIAARHIGGLTLIPPGKEAARLGNLPVHLLDTGPEIIEALERWGVKTLGELAELPELGFIARFGDEGARLMRLARGETRRALRTMAAPENYERRVEFEHRVMLLEPLLLVLSSQLQDLMTALESNGLATNRVTLGLKLDRRAPMRAGTDAQHTTRAQGSTRREHREQQSEHRRTLEFSVPVRDAGVILKQLQFDLEAHPPQAAITGLWVHLNPVEPRTLQHGLFIPQAPAPEKLQLTLARLTALVGEGNAGSPKLLDTHRRDAFLMKPFSTDLGKEDGERAARNALLRFSFRHYRPPWKAQVRLRASAEWEQTALSTRGPNPPVKWPLGAEEPVPIPSSPARLTSRSPSYVNAQAEQGQVRGEVVACAGPWRASGDWWSGSYWSRDEWDVELSDGGVYRIFCSPEIGNLADHAAAGTWFLEGMYD